jgi:hypothetical protein
MKIIKKSLGSFPHPRKFKNLSIILGYKHSWRCEVEAFCLINGWVANASYVHGGWFFNECQLIASLAWMGWVFVNHL